ncbi:MAG TPA: hypothetical protein VHX44_13335 [Planctomycetota bacterium]|nr:hypothetical protein [Planctomycetota bacterium]
MSIAPARTSIQGQSLLAQYNLTARTAALNRLGSSNAQDSALFGSQASALADVANGKQAGTVTSTELASILNRLPTDPKKLERLAQRMDAQVAQLKKRGQTEKASTLVAFADAVRQRAKAMTSS